MPDRTDICEGCSAPAPYTGGEDATPLCATCMRETIVDNTRDELKQLGTPEEVIDAMMAPLEADLRKRFPDPDDEPLTNMATCRVCGCTDMEACTDDAGRPCYWVEPDLCSACAQKEVVYLVKEERQLVDESCTPEVMAAYPARPLGLVPARHGYCRELQRELAYRAVDAEIEAARSKHGHRFVANLPLTTPEDDRLLTDMIAAGRYAKFIIEEASAPSQVSVLMEEIGEIAEAVANGRTDAVLSTELTQVAAVSVAILEGRAGDGS